MKQESLIVPYLSPSFLTYNNAMTPEENMRNNLMLSGYQMYRLWSSLLLELKRNALTKTVTITGIVNGQSVTNKEYVIPNINSINQLKDSNGNAYEFPLVSVLNLNVGKLLARLQAVPTPLCGWVGCLEIVIRGGANSDECWDVLWLAVRNLIVGIAKWVWSGMVYVGKWLWRASTLIYEWTEDRIKAVYNWTEDRISSLIGGIKDFIHNPVKSIQTGFGLFGTTIKYEYRYTVGNSKNVDTLKTFIANRKILTVVKTDTDWTVITSEDNHPIQLIGQTLKSDEFISVVSLNMTEDGYLLRQARLSELPNAVTNNYGYSGIKEPFSFSRAVELFYWNQLRDNFEFTEFNGPDASQMIFTELDRWNLQFDSVSKIIVNRMDTNNATLKVTGLLSYLALRGLLPTKDWNGHTLVYSVEELPATTVLYLDKLSGIENQTVNGTVGQSPNGVNIDSIDKAWQWWLGGNYDGKISINWHSILHTLWSAMQSLRDKWATEIMKTLSEYLYFAPSITASAYDWRKIDSALAETVLLEILKLEFKDVEANRQTYFRTELLKYAEIIKAKVTEEANKKKEQEDEEERLMKTLGNRVLNYVEKFQDVFKLMDTNWEQDGVGDRVQGIHLALPYNETTKSYMLKVETTAFDLSNLSNSQSSMNYTETETYYYLDWNKFRTLPIRDLWMLIVNQQLTVNVQHDLADYCKNRTTGVNFFLQAVPSIVIGATSGPVAGAKAWMVSKAMSMVKDENIQLYLKIGTVIYAIYNIGAYLMSDSNYVSSVPVDSYGNPIGGTWIPIGNETDIASAKDIFGKTGSIEVTSWQNTVTNEIVTVTKMPNMVSIGWLNNIINNLTVKSIDLYSYIDNLQMQGKVKESTKELNRLEAENKALRQMVDPMKARMEIYDIRDQYTRDSEFRPQW